MPIYVHTVSVSLTPSGASPNTCLAQSIGDASRIGIDACRTADIDVGTGRRGLHIAHGLSEG